MLVHFVLQVIGSSLLLAISWSTSLFASLWMDDLVTDQELWWSMHLGHYYDAALDGGTPNIYLD